MEYWVRWSQKKKNPVAAPEVISENVNILWEVEWGNDEKVGKGSGDGKSYFPTIHFDWRWHQMFSNSSYPSVSFKPVLIKLTLFSHRPLLKH